MPSGPQTEGEQVAREVGLALLEISSTYERRVIRPQAGPATLAIVGLVARQRRFLRGAYLLADAGQRLEASILLRAMLEFLIRQTWLQSNPELNYTLWVLDDLEARLRIDREIREQSEDEHGQALEVMEPGTRSLYEDSLADARRQIDALHQRLGLDRTPRYPNLREQAQAVGLSFSYSLAYRFDSLSAAHPSAMAVEQLFAQHPQGVRVLADPPPERGYADPYSVGAFILREALGHAAEQIPELALEGLDELSARLDAVRPGGDLAAPSHD